MKTAQPASRELSSSASRARRCATVSRVLKGPSPSRPLCFLRTRPVRRSARWHERRCGRQALISITGTGHGVGSYLSRSMRPGTHIKTRHCSSAARHDPVERAWLLQNGRLRHSHRNLVLVIAAPDPSAPKAAQHLPDVDACADRPPIDRRAHAQPQGAPGSTAIMSACTRVLGPLVDAPTRKWLEKATKPL